MIDFHSYLTELFDKPFPVRELKRIGWQSSVIEITYQAQTDAEPYLGIPQYLNIDITKINQGWEINQT